MSAGQFEVLPQALYFIYEHIYDHQLAQKLGKTRKFFTDKIWKEAHKITALQNELIKSHFIFTIQIQASNFQCCPLYCLVSPFTK